MQLNNALIKLSAAVDCQPSTFIGCMTSSGYFSYIVWQLNMGEWGIAIDAIPAKMHTSALVALASSDQDAENGSLESGM